MLNAIRRLASTWFGKVLGALLIVGLAGFGISNVILDLGNNTLAKVGNDEITTQAFQRAYQQQLSQVAQQLGYVPTNEQALQLGIPSAVIGRLASESAINQLATQLGLGVSDARLAKMVREDPSFASILGAFDRSTFEQVLRQNGFTEAEYFEVQARASRRQQIAQGLFAGSPTSATALDLLHHYSTDKRTIEYFVLDATKLEPVPAPTEDELTAYLTDHQTQYRTLETRKALVLQLTPEILAAQKTPTEDEVRAEYDRTKDQLVKIEARQIQQVTMPSEGTATWFQLQHDAGVPFADALKVSGLSAIDLGLLTEAQVTDSNLAKAAFGLTKEGDFTVIAGIGNKRVVAVTKIEPGGQISYEDAKADIATRLALNAAKAEYADIQDQIEELRAAFKPLKEIADRFKLPLVDVALTSNGAALSAVTGLAEENRAKVTSSIFAAEEGKLSAAVSLTANNNVYFELTGIDLARDQTLDEVRDALTKTMTDERTKLALEDEAKSIVAELDTGTSFGILATQHDQEATISAPISRDGDGTPALSAQVATAVFLGGPDSHGWTVNGNGDYVIYHVTGTVPAEGEADERTRTFIEEATRDALYAEFVNGLRDELGIQINNQALTTVLALDTAQ